MKYRVRTATLLLTVVALCIAGFSGGGMALSAAGVTFGVCLWMISDVAAASPTRRSAARLANRVLAIAVVTSPHICASHSASGPSPQGSALWKVGRGDLCVTNGVVSGLAGGKLAVNSASSRGVVRTSAGATAEIRFRYLGSSVDSKPLASGEMRRQIGLKLKAQDTCNLLYVMWHIEPDAKLGVSIKRNTGKHTHTECHTDGYTTLKASNSIQPPRIVPGESHDLRAELKDHELEVFADGQRVWVGTINRNMINFDGPVGFRTDNARFEFEYFATGVVPGVGLNVVDERLNRCAPENGD